MKDRSFVYIARLSVTYIASYDLRDEQEGISESLIAQMLGLT